MGKPAIKHKPVAELGQKIAEKLTLQKKKRYKTGHPGHPQTLTAPRFKKGQSGNPGGKRKDGTPRAPKVYLISDELKELLEEKKITKELAQALLDVARDPTHPLMMSAFKEFMDRTEGKVEQKVQHGGSVATARLEVVGATPEELAAIQEFASGSVDIEAEVVEQEDEQPDGGD